MSKKTPLDIQDYLDAASDASKRARTVSFLLVVTSVVVFAGLLNSLQSSWMLQRIQLMGDIKSKYVASKIGPVPPKEPKEEYDAYKKHYDDLYTAYTRSYVENTFAIRVPFFGFTFDINDLGLLGGLAFLILLTLLRFCLSREINNVLLSFSEASKAKPSQLKELYILLAMQQVLTVPQTTQAKISKFLLIMPKVLCFLPLIVHAAVFIHDIYTMDLFLEGSTWHTRIIILSDLLLLVGILIVTLMIVTRLMRLDLIWADCWSAIDPPVDPPKEYKSEGHDLDILIIVKKWEELFPRKEPEVGSPKTPSDGLTSIAPERAQLGL